VIVLVITTYEISLGVFMNDDGGFCHPEDMETRVLCFKHAKTFNERLDKRRENVQQNYLVIWRIIF
jgi:hypothetical protein